MTEDETGGDHKCQRDEFQEAVISATTKNTQEAEGRDQTREEAVTGSKKEEDGRIWNYTLSNVSFGLKQGETVPGAPLTMSPSGNQSTNSLQ